MNKSLITNLLSILFIITGYFIPWCRNQIISIGYFAFSGAITNWLAIYMLFDKVPLLYGSGVIPNRFEEFKSGIRNLIMTEFFTRDNLDRFFNESGTNVLPKINIDKAIAAVDYDKAFNSLTEVILSSNLGSMLGMFGGASVLETYRDPFKNKIHEFIKEETESERFKDAIAESLETGSLVDKIESQVEGIVETRLDELTPKMVKEIIQNMIRKHLGWLVVWGGVFGGLIGLIMSFIK